MSALADSEDVIGGDLVFVNVSPPPLGIGRGAWLVGPVFESCSLGLPIPEGYQPIGLLSRDAVRFANDEQ